jgi:hypothetical protein
MTLFQAPCSRTAGQTLPVASHRRANTAHADHCAHEQPGGEQRDWTGCIDPGQDERYVPETPDQPTRQDRPRQPSVNKPREHVAAPADLLAGRQRGAGRTLMVPPSRRVIAKPRSGETVRPSTCVGPSNCASPLAHATPYATSPTTIGKLSAKTRLYQSCRLLRWKGQSAKPSRSVRRATSEPRRAPTSAPVATPDCGCG